MEYKLQLRLANIYLRLRSRFPKDELGIMNTHLFSFVPALYTQADRVNSKITHKINRLSDLDVMNTLFVDIRFLYELAYWIALSIEKTAKANHHNDNASLFHAFYKKNLKSLVEELKAGRIYLAHIYFDELITYSVKVKKNKKYEKHLPNNGMLFDMEIVSETESIKLGNKILVPKEVTLKINELLSYLES